MLVQEISDLEPRQPNISVKKGLIQVALGQRKADLFIQNGHLVNVYSGEILEGQNVAVCGQHIAYTGPSFTLGFLSFSALPWIRLTPSGLGRQKSRDPLAVRENVKG